jgi:hypothetical protein
MKNRWSAAGSRTSVRGSVIALVGACLLFAGCGSMVAHAKIVAAAGGSGSSDCDILGGQWHQRWTSVLVSASGRQWSLDGRGRQWSFDGPFPDRDR